MKHLLLTLILLGAVHVGFSQTLSGIVSGTNGYPIEQARILDKNKRLLAYSDSLGRFSIELPRNRVVGVEKRGYDARWFQLEADNSKNLEVVLEYSYLEVEEVTVSTQSAIEALDIYSVNILDYQPFADNILTLKREKGTYYIGLDSLGTEGPKFAFNYDRPSSLFLDCMGNMHVIARDSVYQIAVSRHELFIVDVISQPVFMKYLEPCIAQLGESYVMKELSMNNQRYDLAMHSKERKKKTIYTQVDDVTAKIAGEEAYMLNISQREEYYNDSIDENELFNRRYLRSLHNGENPDVNLAFMRENGRNGWGAMMASYMMYSYPIDVRSFQVQDFVTVVDFEIDLVSIYNADGICVRTSPFEVREEIKEVWQDPSDESIYLYTRSNGNHHIYELDILNGSTTYLTSLRDMPFIRSEKVYEGWLYYREIENGYFGINRVKLPRG